MARRADFKVTRGADGPVVALSGDWVSASLGRAPERLLEQFGQRADTRFDISDLGRVDTAGAFALLRSTRCELPSDVFAERPETARLIDFIRDEARTERRPDPPRHPFYDLLVRAGRGVIEFGKNFVEFLDFLGRLMMVIFGTILRPARLRSAPTVDLMERAGVDALPVVMVTTFFVGAVIAFLGAQLLSQFGASIFTVELIGISMMREFGVVITGVLLAGRSASSFAAEIGAMKMNQEVDAMQVLGIDPFEALVLPRLIAMVLMTPILTFAAVLAGLVGGGIVVWAVLDISPQVFMQRLETLRNPSGYMHLMLGMMKAPVIGAVVAIIGCQQGLEVGGDVESLGRRVTSAVVQAIFAIILIDAAFALVYMQLNI